MFNDQKTANVDPMAACSKRSARSGEICSRSGTLAEDDVARHSMFGKVASTNEIGADIQKLMDLMDYRGYQIAFLEGLITEEEFNAAPKPMSKDEYEEMKKKYGYSGEL